MELQELIEKAKPYYPELFWPGRDEFDALMAVETKLVQLKQVDDLTPFEVEKLKLLPEIQALFE